MGKVFMCHIIVYRFR